MDFVERWAANAEGGLYEQPLILVRDGRVESVVELPEPDAGTVPWSLTLLASDDGFIAFKTRSDGLVQTWTSPDGLAWTVDEVLGDDPGEPAARVDQAGLYGGFEPNGLVAVQEQEFDESVEMWLSSDGVEWQAHRMPPGENARSLLGSTWFELAGNGRLTSFPLDDAADPTPVDLGLVRPAAIMSDLEDGWFGPIGGNTISNSEVGAEGEREHWIVTFDDLPL